MTICLITRAQPGADASVEALKKLGIEAIATPAAFIVPTHAPAHIEGIQALLMTSAAAARNVVKSPELLAMPVFAVGDTTAATALEMGFETVISAGGDGATLAVLAADRLKPGDGALLHLRGHEVAGDVTGMLTACGFETRAVEVYHTQDAPDFRETFTGYISAHNGTVVVHSPAGGRRIAAALVGFEERVSSWHLCGLSLSCLAPLGSYGFKSARAAQRPDEKSLLEVVLSTHF